MLPIQTPDNLFHDGTPGAELGTVLSAAYLNAVQSELSALSIALGLPLTVNNNDLMKAILSRVGSAGGLSFRNLLINAAGKINQRNYVSGAATTAANQYTLDRWRVVVSGQNLSWVNDVTNTLTAPAGGIDQVIEGANILAGTYVLNWIGTATATVNGLAVAKGGTVVLPANTNATVRFSSGTVREPQLEMGSTPTAFEHRNVAVEVVLCQRYFERAAASYMSRVFTTSYQWMQAGSFMVEKRVVPAMTITSGGPAPANGTVYFDGVINANLAAAVGDVSTKRYSLQTVSAPSVLGVGGSFGYSADAEL